MTPVRNRGRNRDRSRDRGLSPVVGKTLELGVGVLFVALLTATFFGGIAPEYRAVAGAELGDRTAVAAAERIEAAVPGDPRTEDDRHRSLDRSVAVRLPPAIRGDPYRIAAERDANGAALALDHPDPAVGGRVRLALPQSTEVRGAWSSSSPSRAFVRDADGRFSVTLVDGEPTANATDVDDEAADAVNAVDADDTDADEATAEEAP